MAGYFSVQSLPRRVRICALPASTRACIRSPSNLISCSQSGPSGAFSTSLASCGLIQAGGEVSSTPRRVRIVRIGLVRADFAIAILHADSCEVDSHLLLLTGQAQAARLIVTIQGTRSADGYL